MEIKLDFKNKTITPTGEITVKEFNDLISKLNIEDIESWTIKLELVSLPSGFREITKPTIPSPYKSPLTGDPFIVYCFNA